MGILLTGATGFVGKCLFSLIEEPCRCVFRNGENAYFENKFIVDSIDSNTNWNGSCDNISVVIHLAGLAHSNLFTVEDYQSVNVDGSLHLAREAAKAGVKRFIFVSSIGVNGTSSMNTPYSIYSELRPHNAYTQSKYETEIGLKKIADETGMELVIVRPTLVYGPNAPGNFGLLTALINKTPFLPFALINNKRDFISVQNLSDLLITCAKHKSAGGHTFLASESRTVTIKEFTNAIAKGLGKNVIQLPVPAILLRLTGKLLAKSSMIEQLIGNLEVDSSNLQEILDWTPPYSMEESMAFLHKQK